MADDPLLTAIRRIREAQRRAEAAGEPPFTPEEIDDFVRRATDGKVGYTPELAERIASRSWVEEPAAAVKGVAAGLLQGATFGFGDELAAGVGARLGFPVEGVRAADAIRGAEADAPPGAAATGRMAGAALQAFALPTGVVNRLLPRNAGFLRTTAGGAAVGGAEGALQAAGDAAPGERLAAAGTGGVVGMAAGGAVTGLPAFLQATRPAVRAERRLMDAYAADGSPARANNALADIRAAGREPMLADLSPALRNEARFAGTNDARTREAIGDIVEMRRSDLPSTQLSDLRTRIGNPQMDARLEQLQTSRQAWAESDAGFGGLRRQYPVLAMAPEVRSRLRQPKVRAAFNLAREAGDMTDDSALTQFLESATQRDGALTITDAAGEVIPTGTPRRARRAISFEDLHTYKQLLDDRAASNFTAGRGALGRAYATLRDEVDDALAEAVPEYAQRRQVYRRMMEDERALANGWKQWNATDLEGLRTEVARLEALDPSGGHLREFRRGMAAAWVNELNNTATGRNVAREMTRRSAARDAKIRIVFDDPKVADAFFARAAADAELIKLEGAVNNSVTAFSLAQNAGADAVDLGASVIAGNPIMAAGRGVVGGMVPQAVNRATAQAMRPMLFAKHGELDDLLRRFNDPRLGRRRATLGTATAAGAGGGLLAGQDR